VKSKIAQLYYDVIIAAASNPQVTGGGSEATDFDDITAAYNVMALAERVVEICEEKFEGTPE